MFPIIKNIPHSGSICILTKLVEHMRWCSITKSGPNQNETMQIASQNSWNGSQLVLCQLYLLAWFSHTLKATPKANQCKAILEIALRSARPHPSVSTESLKWVYFIHHISRRQANRAPGSYAQNFAWNTRRLSLSKRKIDKKDRKHQCKNPQGKLFLRLILRRQDHIGCPKLVDNFTSKEIVQHQ